MAAIEAEVIQPETPRKRSRQYYSDADRARALALYDLCGSLTETSQKSGIPDSTLSQWIRAQAHARNQNTSKLRNEIGRNLADEFEDIAHDIARVARKKLAKRDAHTIPFGQLMAGSSSAVQNMQLLRGQPTSIHEERTIDSRQVLILLQETIGPSDSTPSIALNPASTDT